MKIQEAIEKARRTLQITQESEIYHSLRRSSWPPHAHLRIIKDVYIEDYSGGAGQDGHLWQPVISELLADDWDVAPIQ